jgi:hypothetical protein
VRTPGSSGTCDLVTLPISFRLARVFMLAMLLVPALPSPAHAQPSLPEEISTAAKLTPEQLQRTRQYAEDHAKALTGPDAADVNRARRVLVRPLESPRTSVDFRLSYGEILLTPITKASQDSRDLNAVNALVVAAAIGTDQTSRVLEDALKSPRIPVRFAAANGLGRMIELAGRTNPAITPDRALSIVGLLRKHAETEQEPEILGAAMRGLQAGMQISNNAAMGRLREQAAEGLAAVAAARVKDLNPSGPLADALKPFARAAEGLRSALINPDPRLALADQSKTASGNFAKEALRSALAIVQSPRLKPAPEFVPEALAADRAALADFVRLAQSVHEAAAAWTGAALTPGEILAKGDDAAAIAQIETILKR